jgi:hypothetical protein
VAVVGCGFGVVEDGLVGDVDVETDFPAEHRSVAMRTVSRLLKEQNNRFSEGRQVQKSKPSVKTEDKKIKS